MCLPERVKEWALLLSWLIHILPGDICQQKARGRPRHCMTICLGAIRNNFSLLMRHHREVQFSQIIPHPLLNPANPTICPWTLNIPCSPFGSVHILF